MVYVPLWLMHLIFNDDFSSTLDKPTTLKHKTKTKKPKTSHTVFFEGETVYAEQGMSD